jgi:phosphate transport system ATP-binding protein
MIIEAKGFSVRYGPTVALKALTLAVRPHEIFAVIGPAGGGKTTFLRCLNRINDLVPGRRVEGELIFDGVDLYRESIDVPELRRRLGMVFATPVPLPASIYDNIAFGPRLRGTTSRPELDRIVESTLKAAYLWDEVKDRLAMAAPKLSGGQQQRLCLARTLALDPDVLLLDEPCSGLDPISTAKIEEALVELKSRVTIVLVTNNVMQASRVSDRTAFFLQGELVELNETRIIFTHPRDPRTADYLTGRFG